MITQRQARSIIRKAVKRVPEGEVIRHLNIMPMMDIMTILLVAFIFQAAVGAEALKTATVDLPDSVSHEPMPEAASVIIISREAISVESEQIVSLRNGEVDASDLEGGTLGVNIPRLAQYLSALRRSDEEVLQAAGKPLPKVPELMVIADRLTSFRLLWQVIYTATRQEVGYKRFRLIVLKFEEAPAAGAK